MRLHYTHTKRTHFNQTAAIIKRMMWIWHVGCTVRVHGRGVFHCKWALSSWLHSSALKVEGHRKDTFSWTSFLSTFLGYLSAFFFIYLFFFTYTNKFPGFVVSKNVRRGQPLRFHEIRRLTQNLISWKHAWLKTKKKKWRRSGSWKFFGHFPEKTKRKKFMNVQLCQETSLRFSDTSCWDMIIIKPNTHIH